MTSEKLKGDGKNHAKDIPRRQWNLDAVDGDKTILAVRLDSTLNSEG